jgi:uncharacterized membrane protein YdjX (TVP38/TMEM64 family)
MHHAMVKPRRRDLKDDPMFWFLTLGGFVLIVAFVWWFDLKWLHDHVEKLNGVMVFVSVVVLPLAGVPVSVLYAVAGARFGHTPGLLLAVAAIALHLIASWWITHSWLKGPLEALLRRFGRQKPEVPEGEYVPVCLLVALVPGASYALKNYLLVLAGVPFRQFFWTLLPAHFFHAKPRIIFLVSYALLLIGLSHYVVWRLKRRKRRAGQS